MRQSGEAARVGCQGRLPGAHRGVDHRLVAHHRFELVVRAPVGTTAPKITVGDSPPPLDGPTALET
eukprot:6667267-Pyramimonas_sp.AAC.1